MSEKLARNDIDNLGETRTARNRSVFRLQMQLWPCDSTRSGTIEANRSPKRRFRIKYDSLACVTPLPVLRAAEADEENRNALDRTNRKTEGELRLNSDSGKFGVVRWGAALARPISDATHAGRLLYRPLKMQTERVTPVSGTGGRTQSSTRFIRAVSRTRMGTALAI